MMYLASSSLPIVTTFLLTFNSLLSKSISFQVIADNSIITGKSQSDSIGIENIDEDMNGFDFEQYAGELLYANGFDRVQVTQASGDFGVDVIAYKDDIKYAIQCKKYSSPVGIKAVQEVIASKTMNDCHVAAVLTNNTFTKSAKELASKNNVLLWDRDKLQEFIDKYNIIDEN